MYNYDLGGGIRYDSEEYINNIGNMDGGVGSGNWGHEGRPGKVGGSASGGGKQYRSGTKEIGFSSTKKQKKETSKQAGYEIKTRKSSGGKEFYDIYDEHGQKKATYQTMKKATEYRDKINAEKKRNEKIEAKKAKGKMFEISNTYNDTKRKEQKQAIKNNLYNMKSGQKVKVSEPNSTKIETYTKNEYAKYVTKYTFNGKEYKDSLTTTQMLDEIFKIGSKNRIVEFDEGDSE